MDMNDDQDVTLGEIGRSVKRIESSMEELRRELRDDYITRNEFQPVKTLVYGLVGLVLTAVVVALVALVVK